MMPQEYNNLVSRIEQLEERTGKLNFPIDVNSQGAIETVLFKVLKAQNFKGGLPIFTAARTDQRVQGEVYLTDIAGTRRICAFISGTQFCVTIS